MNMKSELRLKDNGTNEKIIMNQVKKFRNFEFQKLT